MLLRSDCVTERDGISESPGSTAGRKEKGRD
jgi:hypothetical protein